MERLHCAMHQGHSLSARNTEVHTGSSRPLFPEVSQNERYISAFLMSCFHVEIVHGIFIKSFFMRAHVKNPATCCMTHFVRSATSKRGLMLPAGFEPASGARKAPILSALNGPGRRRGRGR